MKYLGMVPIYEGLADSELPVIEEMLRWNWLDTVRATGFEPVGEQRCWVEPNPDYGRVVAVDDNGEEVVDRVERRMFVRGETTKPDEPVSWAETVDG